MIKPFLKEFAAPLISKRTLSLFRLFFPVRYIPNHKRVGIELTTMCNLKCFNCDRSCRQAPSAERISLKQIKRFVDETIEKNKKWEIIYLIGGEPTMHPQLAKIIKLLEPLSKESGCEIQILSNGFGEKAKKVLKKLPPWVKITNSRKNGPVNYFDSYNLAAIDDSILRFADFANGCSITAKCGLGFTRHGYYPCGAGAAVDRVFGFDIGRKELPSENDLMQDQLGALCKYCGHFKRHLSKLYTTKEEISPSWQKAYKEYKKNKPVLTLY